MWRKLWSLPIDWFLLLIPVVLSITGIITIYTITFVQHGTSLALSQLVYAIIGLIAMTILMFSDYRSLGNVAWFLFMIGILLLIPLLPMFAAKLPFVVKTFGAARWINLKVFELQPAEVCKILMGIVAAKFLSTRIGGVGPKQLALYLLLSIVPFGLILLQPDLGTASVLLAIFAGLFLAAKPSWRMIAVVLIVFVVGVPIMWSHLKPYQRKRVEIFINPNIDPQGEGYNVRQALIAVGSGGLKGRGFGEGSQTVLNFLPVPHADFIFAGFAEATGFVGSVILLVLYLLLIERSIAVARVAADPFGQLLAISIAIKFFFQSAVHIGMNMALLPVTGIPLPFMSYGGTAMIIDFACIGILQSIYIRNKKIVFH